MGDHSLRLTDTGAGRRDLIIDALRRNFYLSTNRIELQVDEVQQ